MKHVNIKDPDVDGEITTASWVWVSKLPGDGWQFPSATLPTSQPKLELQEVLDYV